MWKYRGMFFGRDFPPGRVPKVTDKVVRGRFSLFFPLWTKKKILTYFDM